MYLHTVTVLCGLVNTPPCARAHHPTSSRCVERRYMTRALTNCHARQRALADLNSSHRLSHCWGIHVFSIQFENLDLAFLFYVAMSLLTRITVLKELGSLPGGGGVGGHIFLRLHRGT